MRPRRAYLEIKQLIERFSKILELDDQVVNSTFQILPVVLSKFERIPSTYKIFSIALIFYVYRNYSPEIPINLFVSQFNIAYKSYLIKHFPDDSILKAGYEQTEKMLSEKYGEYYIYPRDVTRCFRYIGKTMGFPNSMPFGEMHEKWLKIIGQKLNLSEKIIDDSISLMRKFKKNQLRTIVDTSIIAACIHVVSNSKNIEISYFDIYNGFMEIEKLYGIRFNAFSWNSLSKFSKELEKYVK